MRKKYSDDEAKEMRRLYESGMSLRTIVAEHYPTVPPTTVKRCIVRVGGTMRRTGDYGGPRHVQNVGQAMSSKLRELVGQRVYFQLSTDSMTSMLGRAGCPLLEVGSDYLVVRYGTKESGTDYILNRAHVVAIWTQP